jgi:uncharacterized membrane protein HdeD (DUF308 family)
MDDRNNNRQTSLGTVIGFAFILLGILNIFASRFYHRTSINTPSKIPGILFILIGLTIIIVRALRKMRG